MLERATEGYRIGYGHGIAADRGAKYQNNATPGTFRHGDYDEGYKAALNEVTWAKVRRGEMSAIKFRNNH